MIMTSAGQEDQFSPSTPAPHFDVAAPSSNPLVASLPIVVTKVKGGVEVSCTNEANAEARVIAEPVLTQLSNEAEKDSLRFPTSARAHANFGVALANAGRLEEAILELETALTLEPTDYLAGVTLGRVYVGKGDYGKARSLYEGLLNHHPNSDSILLSLAFLSLRDNDYAAAEECLNSVLKLGKKSAFPHFLLGISRLQRGNVHGAISALREAARLDVRRAPLHHTLGVAYVMGEDLDRAERAFRMALAFSPETEPTIHGLCEVLLRQKRASAALDILKQHLLSHPEDATARELLARAYIDLGQHSRGRAQLEVALQTAGENMPNAEKARFFTNIATTFLHGGKNGAAENQLKRAIEIEPRWSSIPYEILAALSFRLNDFEKSREILEHARGLFPDRQTVRRSLSALYARLDRYDLAIAELHVFWEQGTADDETGSLLGSLYEWTEDYQNALRVLKETWNRSPKSPKLINNLAYTYLEVGRAGDARRVLANLPRGTEPHPELVATQGLLRLWEGDRAQAELFYEKAERMASQAGDRNLARRIRQKMYLELAKDSIRKGDISTARAEINRGLLTRVEAYSFRSKLQQLLDELRPSPEHS